MTQQSTPLAARLAEQAAAVPPDRTLTPQQQKKEQEARALADVRTYLDGITPEIAKALPKHLGAERLARIVFTQVRRTPKLALCSKESLMGAVLTCAQLGLEPGPTGEAYFIPRWNSDLGCQEATFELGYKGMVTLFWRHPLAAYLNTETVDTTDEFDWGLGLDPYLIHKPARGERVQPLGYWYAVAKLTNGGFAFSVLDRNEVERRRARSSMPNGFGWTQNYHQMAEKSCIRDMFDLMPKSAEIQRALAWEGQVRTDLDASALDAPPRPESGTSTEAEDGDGESAHPEGEEWTQAGHAGTEARR